MGKIVVTGALGHIGSRLIRALPADFPDHDIVMIDNMMTQRFASLFHLPERGRYRFLEDDVLTMNLEPVLDGAEAVVHLAAITDATGSFAMREKVERENYFATERVAKACLKTGAALFSLSSTSVYGTQEKEVDENCDASELKPQSPYAETKLREEGLLTRMSREEGLNTAILRFGTIFGPSPGMRFHTAVNKFCWQAVMGRPLTVWKTAYNQARPYLDLEDAVSAIVFLVRNRIHDGGIYNVLTLNTTVAEIVRAIRANVPELKVTFVEERIMNQLSYNVSREKFTRLGFTFTGGLDPQIANTINMLKGANRAAFSTR
ncbi:MAG: SDR family oxidoreductase [Candidatus Nitrospinota bacterium M3_3B_026]